MDAFLLIGLYLLVFVGLPVGLGFLFYFVPKKFGYPKTGKYLAIFFGLLVLTIIGWAVFEDQFFTKRNAKELVEEQKILLQDNFELQENRSMSAIGDYYHTFTLKISESDKQNAIASIKSSHNFKTDTSSLDQMPYLSDNTYFGPKVTMNYETENVFVRAYLKPSGKKGYAPTFRRISVNKAKNELTFEDIIE